MKIRFVRSVWLEGCVLLSTVCMLGTAQATPPPDTLIGNSEDAYAFSSPEPYVFDGQTLTVLESFSTDRDISLATTGTLVVGTGQRFELKGQVSAETRYGARLEKKGPGTLRMSGDNGYTGITLLREGTLNVSGGNALGESLFALDQFAGTELRLDDGASVQNFVQVRPTMAGDIPLPGLEGRVDWRVDEGAASLESGVNASLPVYKTGKGTLRLNHLLMGSPDLHVSEGALALGPAANVEATIHVGPDARLEGNGLIADLRVERGGMVAPGGRAGTATLTVMWDAHFEADSLYHVNAAPDGTADLLQVYGRAWLDGQVQAMAGEGDWASENRYRILAAEGGLGGTRFSEVQTDLAFLDPALEYDERNVYLKLTRNDTLPGDLGETPDEEDVGDAVTPPGRDGEPPPPRKPKPDEPAPEHPSPPVTPPSPPEPPLPPDTPEDPQHPDTPQDPPEDPPTGEPDSQQPEDPPPSDESAPEDPPSDPSPPTPVLPEDPSPEEPELITIPLTPLEEALEGMSRTQVRSFLRQSTGSWHASVRSFLMEDSRHVRQAVLAGGRPGRGQESFTPGGVRSWAQVYTASGERSGRDGVEGDHRHSQGLILGLEGPESGTWRPGLVAAVQSSELKRAHGQASAKLESFHTGLSGRGEWKGMRLTAALLRSWHRVDSRRKVDAGPVQESLRADYSATA